MKARIKATGQIVRVLQTSNGDYEEFVTHDLYCSDELVFDVTDKDAIYNKGWQDGGLDPDYWTRLEHQYAGMAMQGILSNNELYREICKSRNLEITIMEYSHTLVQQLKEKEERK